MGKTAKQLSEEIPEALYYSGDSIDRIAEEHLPAFGYACDVGANNGIFLSNSLHFEQLGWIVLCIEPNPRLEAEGRHNRKLWRQVACGRENRPCTFFSVGAPPYASNSTVDLPGGGGEPHQVNMVRLDDALEQAGFPRLDFLTIDVEGYEKEVLAGFTVERWKPAIICVETWGAGSLEPYDGYVQLGRFGVDNVWRRVAEA